MWTTRWSTVLLSLLLPIVTASASVDWVEFINSKAYRRMPRVFQYDVFDDCRADWGDRTRFCIVRAPLVPDDPRSALWHNMTVFSASPRHYNHTLVERGICVPRCRESVSLQLPDLDTPTALNGSSTGDEAYQLRSCINQELRRGNNEFQIDSLEVQECYHWEETSFKFGPSQIALAVIVCGIVVLTIASSLYDRWLQVAEAFPDNYYTSRPSEPTGRELLVAFSLIRNLCRLQQPTSDDRFRADLQVMEVFRVIRMFMIVFLHSAIGYLKLPQHNADFLERYNHTDSLVGYVARFQDSVQTFFLISAILCTVGFLRDRQKGVALDAIYLVRCLANRVLRLLPAYGFVMLLQAAALPYFIDGPLGRPFIGEAAANCQQSWWTNVLFINNFVGSEQPCLLQSWYIAADTQLYLCCMLALSLIWKYRQLKGALFTLALTYGLVAPAVVVYLLGDHSSPLMMVDMKEVDNYMRHQPYQRQLYFPFHLNLAVCFGGVLIGSVYHRYRSDWGRVFRSRAFWLFALVACLAYSCTFVTAPWFVAHYRELPRSLVAIYATIFKHSWGALNALLLLVLLSLPALSWAKQLLCHPIFAIVGRLSYSVYLLHFTVIVLVYGQLRGPVHSTEFIVSTYASQIVLWTYTFSLGLCVLVELPAQNLSRLLLARRRRPKPNAQDCDG